MAKRKSAKGQTTISKGQSKMDNPEKMTPRLS
jgi:hypothetical protein